MGAAVVDDYMEGKDLGLLEQEIKVSIDFRVDVISSGEFLDNCGMRWGCLAVYLMYLQYIRH